MRPNAPVFQEYSPDPRLGSCISVVKNTIEFLARVSYQRSTVTRGLRHYERYQQPTSDVTTRSTAICASHYESESGARPNNVHDLLWLISSMYIACLVCILQKLPIVFAARCYASAPYVVMRCLCVYVCVCLSVTFVSCVETNKRIFKIFSPPGSHTILVFTHQTA